MNKISLYAPSGRCDMLFGETMRNLGRHCRAETKVILTDSNVRRLHAGKFPDCEIVEFEPGEKSKTLESVRAAYEKFLEMGLKRSSMVIGIGGGVVCDIAGFAAATYLRGIRLCLVPTTLVAQADAAIGGKNGVNLEGYKNIVGTIRQPELLLCDFDFLATLPKRELSCGFAEVVKCGAIADAKLFSFLEENFRQALSLENDAIEKSVEGAARVKIGLVQKDERDHGARRTLNFGHTIGHAIEKANLLPHGEAISIGMAIAAGISVQKGKLAQEDAERLLGLLKKMGLPTSASIDSEKIIEAVGKDKKREGGRINMVLLKGIGKAGVFPVEMSELESALNDLR